MPPPPGSSEVVGRGPGEDAVLLIPELRDYERINAELLGLLDRGATRVVLSGAEGQRLLAARLRGGWSATITVEGDAGPELAAEMDAPGLTIHVRGRAADGAGRGLVAGRLDIAGDAGEALGYGVRGGTILVRGDAGHRAGLMQSGGIIVILGRVGRLAGERQSGGSLIVSADRLGPHPGRGHRGGVLRTLASDQMPPVDDLDALESMLHSL